MEHPCPTCNATEDQPCDWLEPGQYHYGRYVAAIEQKETADA